MQQITIQYNQNPKPKLVPFFPSLLPSFPPSDLRVAPLPRGSTKSVTSNEEKTNRSKWAPTDMSGLSDKDKRKILAKIIKISIKTVFKNHMYKFKGRTYRQSAGGAIGLRLTSIVARVIMDNWAMLFLQKLVEAKMDVYLLVKYINNVNLVVSMLKRGSRWTGTQVETTTLAWSLS